MPALSLIMEGLQRLEYRGYDSAGLTVSGPNGPQTLRSIGPLATLYQALAAKPADWGQGCVGIGHTRWATHGQVSLANAHPLTDRQEHVFVVVNGIIENYHFLKQRCLDHGDVFSSTTDAEVLAHLVSVTDEGDLTDAVRRTIDQVVGSFAAVFFSVRYPDQLVAVRRDAPLVLGQAEHGLFIGSSAAAFLNHTRTMAILDNDEVITLGLDEQRLSSSPLRWTTIDWSETAAEKDGYPTFMAKEIAEQPQAVADTLAGRLLDGCVQLEPSLTISERQVTIIGCGTSYHAGLLAQPMLRRCLGRPVDVAIASEWRYDDRPLDSADLVVGMTQSGETADTLAAMRRAQIAGGRVIAVTNVAESQAAREASATMLTRAQLEIGVAATKTFVAQVSALWLLALANAPTTPANRQLVTELTQLPQALADILAAAEAPMAELAERWAGQAFILFLGRRDGLPAAQEGALKLKEIAYVAADAYPAGEMKHGPIALLGPGTPVVGIATESNVFGKMVSNLAEARARGAETLAITSASAPELDDVADFQLRLPPAASWLQPVLAVIPLQLLAYHIATLRGLNVDQPRNLAKTVTVE